MADSSDYEGYDDLMQLGRALTPEDRRQFAPPADLWAKIAGEVGADDQPANVVDIADRRPRRRRVFTGVALVGAAACALVAFAIARAGDDVRTIDEVALSNTGLDPAGASSTGRAKLVVLDDGTRAIDLDVSDLPKVDGEFFELWLIDPQVKGMVSMGPLRGSGRYIIPPGVATDAFPIVDVSIEPVDGVPTHSGVSVLRGVLA
ncbi:MAG: anti-sigma factor [Acidimicrobiales bacterium]